MVALHMRDAMFAKRHTVGKCCHSPFGAHHKVSSALNLVLNAAALGYCLRSFERWKVYMGTISQRLSCISMGDHGDSPSCPISASNEVKSRMLNIDGRDCTFEEALKDENDMLRRLQFTGKRLKIAWILHSHKEDIEKIVAHHLGISLTECKAKTLETKNGSFNICVPVDVTTSSSLVPKKVYFRTPLAHKVGESDHPGNAEEKLRCEIAMYLWLEARHHRVPIVLLRGYSFGKGTAVSKVSIC